uniref:Uncharacterized protein n=1 Tax=Sphaerodactylus townsendi TaxID=933632 RepID=A0ACB8E6C0_9SAUR
MNYTWVLGHQKPFLFPASNLLPAAISAHFPTMVTFFKKERCQKDIRTRVAGGNFRTWLDRAGSVPATHLLLKASSLYVPPCRQVGLQSLLSSPKIGERFPETAKLFFSWATPPISPTKKPQP